MNKIRCALAGLVALAAAFMMTAPALAQISPGPGLGDYDEARSWALEIAETQL